MNLPSRYGSSEYSARAEELFALFVRRRAAGEELDFEAFCAEHPEHADELDGLHADWDNLHGLLGRMGVLGHLADAPTQGAELPSPGAAGPFVDEVDAPPDPYLGLRPARPAPGARAAVLLIVLLGVCAAAGVLGLFARREARAAELLAEHNRRLESEIFELDGRLIDLEQSRQAADERAAQLELEQREAARLATEESQRAEQLRLLAEAHELRASEQERLAEERARAIEEETLRAAAQARIAAQQAQRAEQQGQRAAALELAAQLERRRAAAALVALAAARLERGDGAGARRILEGVDPDRRGFAWRHVDARLADGPRTPDAQTAFVGRAGAIDEHTAQTLLAALEILPGEASALPGAGPVLRASGTSEDGGALLAALSDGRILTVASPTPEIDTPRVLELHRAASGTVGLTLTGGGRLLVLIDEHGTLSVIDLERGLERWSVGGVAPGAPLASGTGLVAARLGPGTVGAWRLVDGLFLGSLGRTAAGLRSFAWTEGGELVLTFANGDLSIGPPGAGAAPLACGLEAFAALGAPPAAEQHADSPCGELRAEVSEGALVLRDLAGGAPILEYLPPAPIEGIAFSADGRHLLAGLASGEARVWTVAPTAVRALWSSPSARPDPAR